MQEKVEKPRLLYALNRGFFRFKNREREEMKMKKRLLTFIVCFLLISTSIVAYAACVTHIVTNYEQDWEFVSVVNVRSGDSHRYAKVVSSDGTVLQWGMCQDTIYTDRQGQRCINCHNYAIYRTVERTVHNPQ